MTTAHIAGRLAATTRAWVDGEHGSFDDDCAGIAAESGYSVEMVAWSLRDLARRLTANTMIALVEAELGSREPFGAPRAAADHACARGATPPSLLFTVLAETVPPVPVETVVLGLLCRAPHLIKTASREQAIARRFVRVLRAEAPELAEHVAVLSWRGGEDDALDACACDLASVVVAYGSNASVDAIRRRSRFPTRFVGYGHRVSFGVVGPAAASRWGDALDEVVRSIALDMGAYDQRGCMSPNVVFVSRDAPWSPRELAVRLAEHALPALSERLPRGTVPLGTATSILQMRGVHDFDAESFAAPEGLVLLHDQSVFPPSPGARTLHVVPYSSFADIEQALGGLRGAISTVGIWHKEQGRDELIASLSALGARRICRLGRMQRPVFVRDHDGRPRISDWVEWTDVEPLT